MAQMAYPARPGYGPQDYPGYLQHSPPPRQDVPRDDNRSSHPPPDAARQGQYHPAPAAYPPPQQWAGQPSPAQPYPHPPPPRHSYDPHYQFTTLNRHQPQPGQAMQPDPYRLPLPYPPHGYHPPPAYPAYPAQPAPAPRQRTAIACKYCRKRKIRCSGYDSSSDGRCQNCVRFSQQCLFHPVSSQAAFVPASALYGPNAARAPIAGADGSQGHNGQHAPPPMLYGAHGQPLGPAGPGGQPQYSYSAPARQPPSQTYPPGPYPGYLPPSYGSAPPPSVSAPGLQYDQKPQAPPTASSDRPDHGSLRRDPSDDDSHNENSGTAHSPHPNTKPRHGYDGRTSGSFKYANGPTSPATSTMSYQSYPPNNYSNGIQPAKGNNSPPCGLTPNSIHSTHLPHTVAMDSRTPPPAQPGSAGSSQNGRSGMKVHEMLGNPAATRTP